MCVKIDPMAFQVFGQFGRLESLDRPRLEVAYLRAEFMRLAEYRRYFAEQLVRLIEPSS